MSIIPVNNQRGSRSGDPPLDLWDQWHHVLNQSFPFFHSHPFGSQVEWKETHRALVLRVVFNSASDQEEASDVLLVYIDDDDMLQISTESGKFMSTFQLPQNAKRDQITTSMINGVLTVTIPKECGDGGVAARNPNVRSIDITGSG